MSPQPSCSKTHLTQPLSLCVLTMAVLMLLPGIKGAGAIASNHNQPRPPVRLTGQIAQSSDARKAEAERLYKQGINQSGRGDVKEALQSWQQALAIYRQLQDREGEEKTLDNLGTASMNPQTPEQLAKAIDYFQQELAIAREIKDRSTEERARYWLEAVYRIQNSQTYKNAISPNPPRSPVGLPQQIAQSSDAAKKAEADRLLQQAIEEPYQPSGVLEFSGVPNYEVVIPRMEAALRLYREIKDRRGEMNALNHLGLVYGTTRYIHYQQAIDYAQQGLVIAREIKDRRGEVNALNNLGLAYKLQTDSQPNPQMFGYVGYGVQRDYRKAIDYYQQSLAIAREIQYRMGEIDALNSLGIVYKVQGDYRKAIDYYQQSLAIAREIKDQAGEVMVLRNLMLVYKDQGDYQQADNYYQQYRQQSLAINKEPQERQIDSNLSSKVKRCRETRDRRCEMFALSSVAYDYGRLDDYPKEIDHFQQALAIAREIKDGKLQELYLRGIAEAYSNLKDYPKEIDYLQMDLAISREIRDPTLEASILNNLSIAYRALGNDTTADEYSRLGRFLYTSVTLYWTRRQQDQLPTQGLNRGLALFKSGKAAEAEKVLLEAIQENESWARRVTSGDNNKLSYYYGNLYALKLYYTLQQVLIAQNKIEPALEIAERGRAKAFAELLAKRLQSTEQPNLQPIQITAIKRVAREQNATLVEYSQINDEQLFIWVVKPKGEVAFRKVDLSPLKQQNTTLAQLIFNSRDSIGVRGLSIIGVVPRPGTQQKQEANFTEQLQQLHKLLIAPITDLLPADPNAHVIFLPQDSLFLAPFAALQDPRGKYLIEQHTIVIAPSIQVLELTHKQRQQVQQAGRQQVLVVGNPKMPLQLPQLPGAQQEAEAIASLFHTQAILGAQATKAAIVQQMPHARWIHLATHGILDDQQGLGSAIALAPNGTGETNDGLLTADEILNLKLNAELVVLSACDSGGGRITGDGVIGLSRSLITAGVPSVLVSLWAIPDAPTASLMQGFYQQLQSNPDKAQALRQTMLSTMKQHPNPGDWAAFMLIGEAQ